MRKNVIKFGFVALLATSFSCNFMQNATEKPAVISEQSEEVPKIEISEESVREKMEYLASDKLKGRETGTEGIEKAATFIEDFFEENDIEPYFETYRDSFEVSGRTAYNIVGFLEGTDPDLKDEFVILGAHYDHIGVQEPVGNDSIANGANDNATGTVAVMELARQFALLEENGRSMLFILFSAEEMGLEGAKHIAQKLDAEGINLYTMFNFEMIGVPMEDKDYLAYLTGYEKSNFAEKFNEYSDAEILGFLSQAKEYNLFQRSDNYPFYLEFEVPAQTMSTFDFTNYDYYHHVSDEVEELNIQHMADLIGSVVPGIYKMTNTSEQEIKLNE